MKKNTVVDFSNIYSPKSQSLLSKGRQNLSPFSKTLKNASESLTQSKPFRRPKEFISNLPKLDHYRMSNKITLTEDRVRQIHERLDVDAKTTRGYELRLKTEQLYFDNRNNPLTRQFCLPQERQALTSRSNIIDELQKLAQPITSYKMSKRIVNVPTNVKDSYMFLHNQSERNKQKRRREDKENIQVFGQQKEIKKAYVRTELEELDDLFNIKQQSFFQRQYRNMDKNIFCIIKDRHHPSFLSNKQILERHYLNFDSIVTPTNNQNKQVFSINFLDHISFFAREIIKGINIQKMPDKMVVISGDLNLTMDRLNFDDIMLINTGKLSSAVLLKYFKQEEEDTSKKKQDTQLTIEQEKQGICYPPNTQNQRNNYDQVNQAKTQIEYYGKSPYRRIQRQQEAISKQYQEKLKKQILDQIVSKSNTIKDRVVVQKFKQEKEKILLKMLEVNADRKIEQLMKEVERKIRMNKINKNRTEKIKIDTLTESFRMKRLLEEKGKKRKSNNKSQSISPLKTWRG